MINNKIFTSFGNKKCPNIEKNVPMCYSGFVINIKEKIRYEKEKVIDRR